MSDKTVLIIGAGQAAAQTAASLRQGGFTGKIMIVGEESAPPYQRPHSLRPISKETWNKHGSTSRIRNGTNFKMLMY